MAEVFVTAADRPGVAGRKVRRDLFRAGFGRPCERWLTF